MALSYITLAVALSLSAIAAWYSIVGLTTIFAAAVIPIVIMGSFLEVAKIVVTVWLHEYWHRCRLAMKLYLVPAVVMLMVITSMGIFGFLSKAHSDQSLVSGDVQSKIAIYDEKIKTEKENIEANRKALKQMDEGVDQILGRSADEKGADKAVALRRSQQKERARLQAEISQSQKSIAELNDARAPIAAEVRKVEAEVGPIKYIASLIYGDNPDANLLERAVRWVIIILVIVFDPLAIMMVLAATESLKWRKQDQQSTVSDNPQYPPDDGALSQSQIDQIKTSLKPENLLTKLPYLTQGSKMFFKNLRPMPAPANTSITEQSDDDLNNLEEQEKENIRRWKAENPETPLKAQRDAYAAGKIDHLPWNPPSGTNRGFGSVLPSTADKGDTFVLTTTWPSKVYKYNGSKWIEIDKALSDQYAYNDQYIQHLIDSLAQGKVDIELLTDAEREQISLKLQKTNGQ
jgi:Skp family chaperone for outer membrane proteins